MKLTNTQIADAVVVINSLAQYQIKDRKTNFNLARNLKRLKAALKSFEEDQADLFKTHFGEKTSFATQEEARRHAKYAEWADANKELRNETQEVDIRPVTAEGLAVVAGQAEVPGALLESIEFLIEDFEGAAA